MSIEAERRGVILKLAYDAYKQGVRRGKVTVDEVMRKLDNLPYEDVVELVYTLIEWQLLQDDFLKTGSPDDDFTISRSVGGGIEFVENPESRGALEQEINCNGFNTCGG